MDISLYVAQTASKSGLALRPWRSEDLAIVLAVYRDPVMRQHAAARIETEADAQAWLDAQQEGWVTGRRLSFAITETEPTETGPTYAGPAGSSTDSPIGNIVLKRPAPDGTLAEVGYWTAPAARGRGVASRALEAVAWWALDSPHPQVPSLVQVNQLELIHNIDNEASCRVAQRSGFGFDAVMPPHPPTWPLAAHRHVRAAGATTAAPAPTLSP